MVKAYVMGKDLWHILEESKKIPADTLNNEITERKWNLKSKMVMWIIQAMMDRENYLNIQDIKELKKA